MYVYKGKNMQAAKVDGHNVHHGFPAATGMKGLQNLNSALFFLSSYKVLNFSVNIAK